MRAFRDLTNEKFGKLLVCEYKGRNEKGINLWLCKCNCGKEKVVTQQSLTSGAKSCGCSRIGNKNGVKHNLYNTRLSRIWHSMYCRCNYPSTNQYKNYGGKGIKVCEEWCGREGFLNFYNWAINNGYQDTLTLDRIDNNKDYTPHNCRWLTQKEQANHRTNNKIIEINGIIKTSKQWCEMYNISQTTLNDRLKRGWTIEQALTISTKGNHRKVNL